MTLEQRYRRLVRVFPAGWRRAHEDELIGTLLDAAEPGRTSIAPREAADLVRAATVLRYRDLRDARLAQTCALALVSVLVVALGIRLGLGEIPLAFLLTSLVVAAIPGTGVFYTVSSSIGGGFRRGVLAAFGCTLGVVPHLLAALLGLSGVMQVGAQVFEVIRYAGVAYLVFMGVSMIRDRRGELLVGGERPSAGPARVVVRRGILLNLLNPKLTLFFFAFLPQFLGSSSQHHLARLIVLGAIFMLVTFAVFAVYAYASALLRERVLGAPVARRWFQGVLGSLLIGIGVKLALADR
jgi:threonine/homoserine/homoserine lactone efflux protein